MTPAPLLDTHAWIWWMDHDRRLGRRYLEALDNLLPQHRPYLCDISLWEVATLFEKGRLQLAVPFAEWLEAAAHPRTVHILQVTPAIAEAIASLPKEFHRDPADRVIIATSRVLQLPLVTKDRLILQSRMIKRWSP